MSTMATARRQSNKPISGDRLKTANQGLRSGATFSRQKQSIHGDRSIGRGSCRILSASFDTDFYSFETRWNISDSYRIDYLYGHWESDEEAITNWDGTPELLYGTSRPGHLRAG